MDFSYAIFNACLRYNCRKPDGQTYYLYSNGEMATGWKQIESKWYYFSPVSTAAGAWVQDESLKWVYDPTKAGTPTGAMLKNTTTPDGYTVDANGVWQ